ncbi:MAG TPA: amino acid adenylation domain-containing protein [Chloroflexia bacterium]|nr:amino acid adenylation domain-containing protein [Chloroflexia bacterium]
MDDVANAAELAARKRELLALLLDEDEEDTAEPYTIVRQESRTDLPLSFAQQRLWFLDQLEPGNPFYTIPVAMRLSGPLDVDALERSLTEIVRRHEVFRTTFPSRDGQPVQMIAPSASLSVPLVDLHDLPAHERESKVQRMAEEEARRPFDLAKGPIVRAHLFRLDEREHVLLLTMHHIMADGWSYGVLLGELGPLYNAFTRGQQSPLPDLPVQYADYAVWQRGWLQGETLDNQLDYWKGQLMGAPPLLELPTDRPRPPAQTYRGAHESVVLPKSLTRQLEGLGRQEGATLFMTLLAAFGALLHRYTGQSDIVIGSPIAGRTRPEVEGLIGLFANTLVMRLDVGGNPTFREALSRVREVALGAYDHQELPFERLVEELHPERNMSYHPLFQVMFVLQNAPLPPLDVAGLTLSYLDVHRGASAFDITLMMADTGEGLEAFIEYNTDLFDSGTIGRMLGHFQTLLKGIVANPNSRVAELPLLTQQEQQQVLVEWNNTYREFPHDKCIHQLFEEQVEKRPDAVALVFGREQLTYSELNSRANKLARHLRKLGVGPEVLVGLCVERSIEMVVGLMGIVKAGGAYVPLDPSYPKDRLAYMLSDSQAPVLVTQERVASGLFEDGAGEQGTQIVYLDKDWDSIEVESGTNLEGEETAVAPDNLAYTIYTSGSTGWPKGVLLEHRGLCNVITEKIRTYGVRPDSCVLQFVAFSFDVSVAEIFIALVSGARLCLGTPDELLPGPALVELMQRQGVTTILMPPSVLTALPDADLPTLESIIVGGENCSAEVVARWAPGRRFFNTYGPTEATICNTIIRCAPDGSKPPIGRTIANTQIYILDRNMQPLPVGIAGEMYIGGVGVARGYHHRPELTADRFVPNPFGSAEFGVRSAEWDEGRRTKDEDSVGSNHTPHSALRTPHLEGRLYRTGDLARYLPDGNIEFVGRTDHQVKIRGFRVEIGEIEVALGKHPGVRESVVIAREDVPGNKRLVAYMVPQPGQGYTAGELRAHLRGQLPDYMVPSAFVTLETLPLSPNGKIDLRALPAPDSITSDGDGEFVAPGSPTEETLAEIWAEALKLPLERISIHSNFFDLGGHSLLVTQVATRISNRLGVDLPLRSLFEEPTVAGLARIIELAHVSDLSKVTGPQRVDWDSEIALDPAIRPDLVPLGNVTEPEAIFITGASGFLGAFVLYELLRQTDARVYCLVRARDEAQGKGKIKANLESYGLWREDLSNRVLAVTGDLSDPMLGMSEEAYRRLAAEVDVIYHNGGLVNFVQPYTALKAANVGGTLEVLRLASDTRRKAVHFVSTLSVFLSEGKSDADLIHEWDDTDDIEGIDDGYSQSKWVAERLIMAARDRGLPACIYRPARITGHSETGLCNAGDLFSRYMKGCIQLGSAPDLDIPVDMAPVDFVSKAIVYLSRQPELLGKTFHIINTDQLSWGEFVEGVRHFGYPLKTVPYERWRVELLNSAVSSVENALEPMLPIFYQDREAPSKKRFPRFDCRETFEALARAGISCPPADLNLLGIYIRYLIESGFMPAPRTTDDGRQPIDSRLADNLLGTRN